MLNQFTPFFTTFHSFAQRNPTDSRDTISSETKTITKSHIENIQKFYQINKDLILSEFISKIFMDSDQKIVEKKYIKKTCELFFAAAQSQKDVKAKKILDVLKGFKDLGLNNSNLILSIAHQIAEAHDNVALKEEILNRLHAIFQENPSALPSNNLRIDCSETSPEHIKNLYKDLKKLENEFHLNEILLVEEKPSFTRQVASSAIKVTLIGTGIFLGVKFVGSFLQGEKPIENPEKNESQNVSGTKLANPEKEKTPRGYSLFQRTKNATGICKIEDAPRTTPRKFVEPPPFQKRVTKYEFCKLMDVPANPKPEENFVIPPVLSLDQFAGLVNEPLDASEKDNSEIQVEHTTTNMSEAEPDILIIPATLNLTLGNEASVNDAGSNEIQNMTVLDKKAAKRAQTQKERKEFKGEIVRDTVLTGLAALSLAAVLANKVKRPKFITCQRRKTKMSSDAMQKLAARKISKTFALTKPITLKNTSSLKEVWPALGMLVGGSFGTFSRWKEDPWNVHSLTTAAFCNSKSASIASKLLTAVNFIKQWEVKNFAPLTPTLIMLGQFTADGGLGAAWQSLKEKNRAPLSNWFKLNKHLPKKDTVISISLFTLAFFTNILQEHAMPAGFDPSGHVIMRSANMYQMLTAYQYLKNSGHSNLANTAGFLMALSEGVFMANTTGCYHRVSENIAGAFFASLLKFGTDKIIDRAPRWLQN